MPADMENNVTTPSEDDQQTKLNDNSVTPPKGKRCRASPGSKYEFYELQVDRDAGDRAIEFKCFSFARPHMRALHCAWISFFIAFMIWFAIAPLLSEIQHSLNLSKKEVWTSSICSDATTIFMRIVVGPLCDIFGGRIPMGVMLCLASIPTAMTGLVNSAVGLSVLRLFVGMAGSTFVMAQFWPTVMFTKEMNGTANGIVGGWGNLGGAFTQVFMGSALFPAFTAVFDGDKEKAWRLICIFPAAIAFIWGIIVIRISDDAPLGYYKEMRRNGTLLILNATSSFRTGGTNINTWLLYLQYACCFGVELIMNNGAVLYFTSEFDLSTESAAAIGSVFGWMNLFARVAGGYYSDITNLNHGMRGRLWLQAIFLLVEGALIVVFAHARTLGGAIVTMAAFSLFVQAAEGAVYGVVPYVNNKVTGTVAGIVGAGGNFGGVVFGFIFRSLSYKDAFVVMGVIVMCSSLLTFLIRVPGYTGMISGSDSPETIEQRKRFIRLRNERKLGEPREQNFQEEETVINRASEYHNDDAADEKPDEESG